MSGVAIVRYQLANDATLNASVPGARIMAGVLPRGTSMPAISLSKVSSRQHGNLAMNASSYLMTDRIQVTVLCRSYPELESLIEKIRDALPLSRGTIAGFSCEGIIPDTIGPDQFDQEQKLYSQSLDFQVSWIRQMD